MNLRQDTAKNYKEIRKILRGNPPSYCEEENMPKGSLGWLFWPLVILLCVLMLHGCEMPAHAYTDEQYVNAIRHAEGVWTYGIKTVKCTSEASCRRIALQTVRNNRVRFEKYGFRHYPSFTQFLGSRYCPTTGRDRTPCEVRLNQFWVKNVSYFLRKDV